jgi:probable rRNA maturation factor
MYCLKGGAGNQVVKSTHVNFTIPAEFKRKLVHNSVSFLKKELNFDLDTLVINFVSTEEIININREYLNHNYSTDIITFNYSETKSVIDGEIYISVDEVILNARKYGSDLKEEIIRMVTHGILHLLGYDDKNRTDKFRMKRIEDKLVKNQKHIWLE